MKVVRYSSWLSLALILTGVSIAIPAFVLSSSILSSVGLLKTIVAFFVSGLIWSIIGGLVGVIGVQERKSTYELMKAPFGIYGGKLLSCLVLLTLAGWYAINCSVFGSIAERLLIQANIHISEAVITFVSGLLMSITAVIGYRTVKAYSIVVVPVLLIILIYASYSFLTKTPLDILLKEHISSKMDLLSAISIAAGALMLGVIVAPDLSQYTKNKKQALVGVFLGYGIGAPLVLVMAAIAAASTGQSNLTDIFAGLGLSAMMIFPILTLSAWDTNDTNLFSASLAAVSVFENVSRWQLSIAIALVSSLLATFGIINHFQDFLIILTVIIPPVGGVLIAHYFSNFKRSKYPEVYSFLAYAFGIGVSYATMPVTFNGLELFTLTFIPALDGILVAFFLHFGLHWYSHYKLDTC